MLEYVTNLMSHEADEYDYESLPTSNVGTHMLSGAMAGMTEHVLMYPLDSVKTRMQTLRPNPNASYRSVTEALQKMILYEGLFRPMKGVSAVICSAAPAHALYFACYEKMKTVLSGTSEAYRQQHWTHGVSGGMSTLLHDAVMNPAEVVKQRMQVYNSPYKSCLTCMVDVYQREGIRAFYRSYTTTITMNVPFQFVHFISYEVMQNLLNREREYNPKAHIISGGVAGGFAAAVTTPLDVCRTLINTQEKQILQASKQRSVTGLISAAATVYRCCGVSGYFNGLRARVLYSMPATAISWAVYEFLKYFLIQRNTPSAPSSVSASSSGSLNLNLPKPATVIASELGNK